MNGLDLLIVLCVIAAVAAGFRLGLVARVCSWLGLLAGLVITTANMGTILGWVGDPKEGDEALAMAVVLLLGCWLGKALGMAFGRWLHAHLPARPLRTADRVAGSAFGLVGVVVVVWVALPLLAVVPGWPAEQARASAVARLVHERLPEPPRSLAGLRGYVEGGSFPSVLGLLRRAPSSGAVPASVPLDGPAVARVRRSVLEVRAVACSRLLSGTGFVVGDGLVVTNAHVVAGSKAVTATDDTGTRHAATVRAYDPSADLALLAVDGLAAPPLPRATGGGAARGDTVAVLGHPGGGPLRVAPGSVTERVDATGRDLYNHAAVEREVLVLAARLRPGDSGAPVVGSDGAVVGVAFAVAPDASGTAYALSGGELDAFLVARPGRVGDTRGCISG